VPRDFVCPPLCVSSELLVLALSPACPRPGRSVISGPWNWSSCLAVSRAKAGWVPASQRRGPQSLSMVFSYPVLLFISVPMAVPWEGRSRAAWAPGLKFSSPGSSSHFPLSFVPRPGLGSGCCAFQLAMPCLGLPVLGTRHSDSTLLFLPIPTT
jgi:hypothetical protein